MTLLHDAYVALLSGLTTRKNESEIWWHDRYGLDITVEPLDAAEETYIVRHYDGVSLISESHYKSHRRHGPYLQWGFHGQLECRANYADGQIHGTLERFYSSGQRFSQADYVHGVRHGVHYEWGEEGQLLNKHSYMHGARHGPQIDYRECGLFNTKSYYENGFGVRRKWNV